MINIPLDIENVEVINVDIRKDGKIFITVKSMENGTNCSKCGQHTDACCGHGKKRVLRHTSVFGKETYIIIYPKKYKCKKCNGKTTTQAVSWYEPRSRQTAAYEKHILLLLVNSTVTDVAIKENIGYDAVEGIIDRYIAKKIDWESVDSVEIMGIDEISAKKGHGDFITLITARVNGKVIILAVLEDRKKETVKEFLSSIPKRLQKTVKAVCTDMYDGFINAVKEVLPKSVKIVIDRFHVAKLYRGNVDTLRKSEMRRLKEELSEEEYKLLKGVMWILRKSQEELTKEEEETLRLLFLHSPLLEQAYNFMNELTAIFDEDITKQEAEKKINDWKRRVRKSELKCFDRFLLTFEKYMNEITSYFADRNTSGFAEGLNNKAKVIKRRSYGLLNPGRWFQRLCLDISGYSMLL